MSARRRQRGLAATGLGIGMALVLAACGKGSNTTPTTAGGFNAALNAVVNPSTKTGGTLQLITNADCDSWDPARTYYAHCWDIQRLFERTLMAYAAKPGMAGTQLVPDLATAPGVPSDNSTVWTYHIRQGVKFSTGAPVTAQDIKYAIERVFATSVINGGPTYVLCLLSTCNSSGSPAYPGPYVDKNPAGLTSIQTPDPYTLIFHLTSPYSDWNYIMALPDTAPVPQADDTGARYTFHPVSTGPFMIQSYTPGIRVVLVRNPYWSQATDPLRHPLPTSVVLTIDSNAIDIDNRLLAGAADIDIDGTGVQPATQARILADPSLLAHVDDPLTGFIRYLAVFQTVPPLNNKACRLAVFYAVDKTAILLARGGGTYGGTPAGNMLPLNIAGADQSYNPYPNGADFGGDLAKARQELGACGHPNGFTTRMAYATSGKGPNVFAAVQAALARVGIKVNPAPANPANYYSTWIGSPANIKAQGIGLGDAGWGADFPTGVGFFYAITDGEAILPIGNSNYVSLNDPVINADLVQLKQTTDPAQRAALDSAINHAVMNDAVYLPYDYDKAFDYRNPRVTNVYINGAFGIYDFVSMGVG